MKKVVPLFLIIIFFLSNSAASAATLYSAKPYMPSTKYLYSVYDEYAYPEKHVIFRCKKWDADHLHCARNEGMYTYHVTKTIFAFNDGGDTAIVTPYHFPLTKDKSYYKTGYEGMNSYNYSYKVIETNMKKKIGKKTYTSVIKIRNNYDKGFTYIAKNHGVILITTKKKGKQVPIYKVKTYYK